MSTFPEDLYVLEAVIEYDEVCGGNEGERPFKVPDQALPFTSYRALREECSPLLLKLLRSFPARGLPDPVSPWALRELKQRLSSQAAHLSWVSHLELQEHLRECQIDPEQVDIGTGLLLKAMKILALQVGRERVRLLYCVVPGEKHG